MARGGGAGGGRSSGGGGNRSFGGRSGGGGSNRGGINRGGSSGGFKGGTPNRGMGGGMGHGHGMGRMHHPPPPPRRPGGFFRRPYYGGGSNGCGCLTISIIVIIAIVVGAVLISFMSNGSSFNVTASTIEREPLPAGSVNETGYYTDELGWIGNSTTLTSGMKNFYKETGVQPYLYITDTINGTHNPTSAQIEQFAYETYDLLFTDEAHVLVIFFEYNDNYSTYYLAGTQAKTVLDNEAMDILLDYIDKYYYDWNLTDAEMFSQAFNDAGTRIMEVTTSPWIPVLIILGILAIIIVIFIWWKNYKKQKNLEAEQTEKILNTPLETFGDSEAEDIAKKYDD